MLLDFFEKIKDKSTGMKRFMAMGDLEGIRESIGLRIQLLVKKHE
jgi:hypothetical protein